MKRISIILAVVMLFFSMNLSFAFAQSTGVASGYNPSMIKVWATQKDDGEINVSWDCSEINLKNFRITEYKDSIKVSEEYVNADTWEWYYIDVEDGATYTFYVDVIYNDNTSYYNQATLTFDNDLSIPNAPNGLAAKIESNGDVTLTWTDNSIYEMGFELAKEDSNGDGGIIKLNTIDLKKYVDTAAHTAGMTYKYKIRSYNQFGASSYSNEVSVTIPNSASDVPSSCAAQQQTDGSIKVTWKDNSNWETGFTVMRTDGSGTNKYFEAAANATSYTDTEKLTAGATYKYKVCAHDDNGQTDYSNQVSITIPAAAATTPAITVPAAPSNLTAKQDQDKIKLTWQDNSDNETGFTITRTDDKTKTSTTATVAAGTKSYNDAQGIEAGTTYTYSLKAVNSAGSSSEAKVSISATGTIATGLNFDGTQSSWAKTEITAAYNDGLTYDGVLSDFGRNITREEFCTIVVKMYEKISGKTASASDDPFTDTTNADILKAYKLGIVKGTSATTFSPDSKITRQEISVMITRCLEASVSGINISSKNELAFADKGQIASWAKESMGFCNSVGIMNGVGSNKIAPLSNTTREQAIALIERTFQEYN